MNPTDNPLHVCHVTTVHPWNDIRIFRKMCCSLAEQGLRVTLVAPVDKPSVVEGVQVVPTGLSGKFKRLAGAPFLLHKLKRIGAQIYHFHDPELLPWMTLFQKLVPSAAVVYDVHEYYPEVLVISNFFRFKWLSKIMSGVVLHTEPVLAGQLHGVIGVTDPIADRFRKGRAHVTVIRNLVKLTSIQTIEPSENERMTSALDEVPGLLVLGGTITNDRCMDELVEAMAILHRRGQPLQLICIGSPHPPGYGDELMDRAARLGIEGQVRFEKSMPFEAYQRYVARSKLGMVLYSPGLNNMMGVPNRLYEYMAHGVPVVASDFPEVARVVRDAECGSLVDSSQPEQLADAIQYLLTHCDEAERLGANGRAAIEDRYCWEREIQSLIDFYHQITGSRLELSPSQ